MTDCIVQTSAATVEPPERDIRLGLRLLESDLELEDDAFVSVLLGDDEEVDEDEDQVKVDEDEDQVEVDEDEDSDEINEVEDSDEVNEVEDSDEVKSKTKTPEAVAREQLERHVLDSTCAISVFIDQLVARRAAEVEAKLAELGEDADLYNDLIGCSHADSLRGEVESLRQLLEAAVMIPWPQRPPRSRRDPAVQAAEQAEIAARRDRWQRLRILQVVGNGLRPCLQFRRVTNTWTKKPERRARLCSSADKRHLGCRGGPKAKPGEYPCQVGELMTLSQEIGGLDYYGDFMPVLHDGELVEPPEWPSGNTAQARAMTATLWARYHETRIALGLPPRRVPEFVHPMKGQRSCIGAAGAVIAGASETHAATGAPSASTDPAGTAAEGPVPAACTTPLSFHEVDKRAPSTRPSTVRAKLPVSLVARRADLGDHALYVCWLLCRPDTSTPDNARARIEKRAGWRPIIYKRLRDDLGQERVPGTSEKVCRTARLLGCPRTTKHLSARPGLLEEQKIIERKDDYCAAEGRGYSQRYRLCKPYRTGATVEVELILRKRSKTLPQHRATPAVDPWLSSSYLGLRLDGPAALAEWCPSIGLEFSPDPDQIAAMVEAMPGPEIVRMANGKPAKRQPPDAREPLRDDLARLRPWLVADAAAQHKLYRDRTVTRLQSPFARLPKIARKHLSLDGRPLVLLDIRACGLALRAAQLRRAGLDKDPDIERVCDLFEDPERDPYVELFRITHGREPSEAERDAFKPTACGELFYCKIEYQLRTDLGKAIRKQYPGFHERLCADKRRLGHAELANETMRFETSLVLDTLVPRLKAEGIKVAVNGDCIGVRDLDADRAKVLFEEVLRAAGVKAVVR